MKKTRLPPAPGPGTSFRPSQDDLATDSRSSRSPMLDKSASKRAPASARPASRYGSGNYAADITTANRKDVGQVPMVPKLNLGTPVTPPPAPAVSSSNSSASTGSVTAENSMAMEVHQQVEQQLAQKAQLVRLLEMSEVRIKELHHELDTSRQALLREQMEKEAALDKYWDAAVSLESSQKQLQELAATNNAASATSEICTKALSQTIGATMGRVDEMQRAVDAKEGERKILEGIVTELQLELRNSEEVRAQQEALAAQAAEMSVEREAHLSAELHKYKAASTVAELEISELNRVVQERAQRVVMLEAQLQEAAERVQEAQSDELFTKTQLDAAQREHASFVQALQAELESKSVALEELATIVKDKEMQLEALTMKVHELEQVLQTVQERNERVAALEAQVHALEAQLDMEAAAHAKALEAANKAHTATIAQLQEDLDQAREGVMVAEARAVAEVQAAEAKALEQVQAVRTDAQYARGQLEVAQQELQAMQAKLEAAVAEAKVSFDEAQAARLATDVARMEVEAACAAADAALAEAEAARMAVDAARTEADNARAEARAALDTNTRELADGKEAAQVLSERFNADMVTLKTAHGVELEGVHQQHEAQVQQLKRAAATTEAELKAEHSRALAELQQQLADISHQHASASEQLAAGTASLSGQHARALDALREQHADALTSCRSAHAKEVEQLQVQHEHGLATHNEQAAKAVSDLGELHASALAALQARHTEELAAAHASHASALEAAQAMHHEELSSVQAHHKEELCLLQSERAAVQGSMGELNRQLDELQAAHRGQLVRVKGEHAAELQHAQAANSRLTEELTSATSERDRLAVQGHALQQQLSEKTASAAAAYGELRECRARMGSLEELAASASSNADQLSAQLVSARTAELAAVQQALEEAAANSRLQLDAAIQESTVLNELLAEKMSEVAALTTEKKEMSQKLAELWLQQQEMERAREAAPAMAASHETPDQLLERRNTQIATLRTKVEELEGQLSESEAEMRLLQEQVKVNQSLRGRVDEMEAAVRQANTEARAAATEAASTKASLQVTQQAAAALQVQLARATRRRGPLRVVASLVGRAVLYSVIGAASVAGSRTAPGQVAVDRVAGLLRVKGRSSSAELPCSASAV